ncbi:MAG TPA: VCBS repeat-containing protein [Candidatus Latescibacteria bacterium]|jgi:hypothetical protein|nr:VCBS repeat-containing protein [Candidatus Latescibacterota bacterium]
MILQRLLLCLTVVLPLAGLPDPAYASSIDQTEVERVEDLSEGLANQLHDLSLSMRDRDMTAIATHFGAGLSATPWPGLSDRSAPQSRWVEHLEAPIPTASVGRRAFLASWQDLLGAHASIEDVRLKVKSADFEGVDSPRAEALIAIAIVGRTPADQRTWVEAKAHLGADQTDGRWHIDHLELSKLTIRTARVDLFSEVSLPAGVYQAAPPFGTPGNPSFIAHGVALGDVDMDGRLDAFTTGHGGNFLYLNQGDGTFTEVAAHVGVQITPTATAPLFVDVDNDGDSDLFLASTGHQMLFENRLVPDGSLEFRDVSLMAGVDRFAQGYSAVTADVNGDGYPDIYVASYNKYGVVMPDSWSQATNGTANLLLVNQGDGSFLERARKWGVADSRWSYAAHFGDFDGDDRQDLYVANDFGQNALYLNQGDHFTDAAGELGLLDPGNGMGVSLGDYNNDGHVDLHVTNMSSTAGKRILKRLFPQESSEVDATRVLGKLAAGNSIFRNLGDGTYEEVSATVGPLSAGWAWGGGFVDLDNDGWQDIHAPNGFVSGKSLKDT